MRQYSPFFQTLYDELAPVGQLGHGTHYSVLRCVVWQDETRMPIPIASALDFAIESINYAEQNFKGKACSA